MIEGGIPTVSEYLETWWHQIVNDRGKSAQEWGLFTGEVPTIYV